MDPSRLIISSEQQFKKILEGFFLTVYNESLLPSHGIDHHRRVWRYAVELLNLPGNTPEDSRLTDSLIIASYLHDAGMAYEPGPRHGWKSAELCRRFLELNNLDEKDFPGLLNTIIEHDNKDYPEENNDNLLKLLSLADDLDAFGFAGIYRYLEIYFHRGIEPLTVAGMIRTNAAGRFRNFSRCVPGNIPFFINHEKRFIILDEFFKACQAMEPGYAEVVEKIRQITTSGQGPQFFISLHDDNPVMTWFKEGLIKEMGYQQ
ncbi:MAG TPA: HD domain-containing protein [Bacteroidales bacterium]|nr:HD domain-containing protein [Bacteroidales bacterium]